MKAPNIIIAITTLGVLCTSGSGLAQSQEGAARQGTFEARWVASGTRQRLRMGEDREVFTYRLEGLMNVRADGGVLEDYWAICIGLWDPQTGGTGRCVWRAPDGDLAYSETSSRALKTQQSPGRTTVVGTTEGQFTGGTGDLEGLQGGYEYDWSALFFVDKERKLEGFAPAIKGNWRLP